MTSGGPHVHAARGARELWGIWILALLPCALQGLWNTGYQVNTALAAGGLNAAPGWRGALLTRLGLGIDAASPLACFVHGALWFAPVFATAAVTARGWEVAFARARGRPLRDDLALTPLLFALSLPPAVSLWQVALCMSFGVVLAREVYGGIGRNFVNVPLASRAFLYFAYPAAIHGDGVWIPVDGVTGPTALALGQAGGLAAVAAAGVTWTDAAVGRLPAALGAASPLCCLVGAGVLVATRAASWRVMAGGVLGLVAGVQALAWIGADAWPMTTVPWWWHLVLGSFAFGIVFLATDPPSAARTDAGRWLYGLVIGALTALVRVANPAYPEGIMLAILFANVTAPLIDHVVVRLHLRQGAMGHG